MLQVPAQITNFRDLEKLNGIGPSIRSRLEKRYVEEFGGLPDAALAAAAAPTTLNDAPLNTTTCQKRTRTSRNKEYVPAFRSGPYAMLIALHLEGLRRDSRGFLFKDEIISIGQPYCSAPMDEGTFSPINGAIKTLISKDLVHKRSSNPAKFSLTLDGSFLAERLWNSGERRSSAPLPEIPEARDAVLLSDNASDDSGIALEAASPAAQEQLEIFSLAKNTFDVVLIVDSREIKSREERTHIVEKLSSYGIKCEQRSLELGDFLWIARAKAAISTCSSPAQL